MGSDEEQQAAADTEMEATDLVVRALWIGRFEPYT